jgi:hypothetical protein
MVPSGGSCTPTTAATGDVVLQSQSVTSNDTVSFAAVNPNTNLSFCYNRYGFSTSGFTGTVQFDTTPVNVAKRRCVAVSGVGHAQVLQSGHSDAGGATSCP